MAKTNIVIVPDILLPNQNVALEKWATIACDQFTSNTAYWEEVETIVGESPSTVKITFPECYLGKIDELAKIKAIQSEMNRYLQEGRFAHHKGFILVERQIDHGIRYGLLATIDLEDYDFTCESTSWIRATEGTVAERIPPRIKIREGAPLEVPHILVLVDDVEKKLIEPLIAMREKLPVLYDFDLMMGSGHIRGYSLADPVIEQQILGIIADFQSDIAIENRYGAVNPKTRIVFAIGDGNHSLATAKTMWEQHKAEWGMNHPARYALVELENLHDPIMEFEPIHRVLFGAKNSLVTELKAVFGDKIALSKIQPAEKIFELIDQTEEGVQSFGILENGIGWQAVFREAPSELCVGSVQQFLDQWKKRGGFDEIDYIHGAKELAEVSIGEGKVGIYLPPVQKNGFFQGIISDGALPRKTFSMGEAHEKRFYIECRRILE